MIDGCRLWVESAVPIQCIGVVLLTKISYVVPEEKSPLFSLSAEEGQGGGIIESAGYFFSSLPHLCEGAFAQSLPWIWNWAFKYKNLDF